MTWPFLTPNFLGGVRGAAFVGATQRDGAGPLAWPLGTTPGDYGLFFVARSDNAPVSGYTNDPITFISTGTIMLSHKRLTQANIDTPPIVALASDHAHALVYRGPLNALVRASAQSATGDTTLNIPGIVKVGGCRGLVNVVMDRAGIGSAPGTPPAYLTTRSSRAVYSTWSTRIADALVVRNYADNTAAAWTGFNNASGFAQIGAVIELI